MFAFRNSIKTLKWIPWYICRGPDTHTGPVHGVWVSVNSFEFCSWWFRELCSYIVLHDLWLLCIFTSYSMEFPELQEKGFDGNITLEMCPRSFYVWLLVTVFVLICCKRSASDDSWTGHWYMSIADYLLLGVILSLQIHLFVLSVFRPVLFGFPQRTLGYVVSGAWLPKQCQVFYLFLVIFLSFIPVPFISFFFLRGLYQHSVAFIFCILTNKEIAINS